MTKEEVIKKLEKIQWRIRHNIPSGVQEIDDNDIDDNYEEHLNFIKDKLFYLKHTNFSIEEIFDEDELLTFNIV